MLPIELHGQRARCGAAEQDSAESTACAPSAPKMLLVHFAVVSEPGRPRVAGPRPRAAEWGNMAPLPSDSAEFVEGDAPSLFQSVWSVF